MGSGESDAVRSISVNTESSYLPVDPNWYYWQNTSTWTPTVSTYTYTNTVYLYQIKCPVRSCKKMNWLKLDTITPCTKCGAKLKAVSEQADFEVPISE